MWRTDSKMARELLWFVACTVSLAADVARAESQLSISDPRPVAKAMEVLSDRHALVITYEDPPYAFEDDVKDVTAAVARGTVQPGHRTLVPRGGAMELTYSLSSTAGKLEQADALIRKVLDTHLAAGGRTQFEVMHQGDEFHVVPVMVKDSAGAWIQIRPILDTRITVPLQSRSGAEMVDSICNALAAATQIRVAVGISPMSALGSGHVTEGGTNEPARDILSRSLQQLSKEAGERLGAGEERPYVWQLLFDPGAKTYFLNLTLMPPSAVVTQSPNEEQPDPAALDPVTGKPPQ